LLGVSSPVINAGQGAVSGPVIRASGGATTLGCQGSPASDGVVVFLNASVYTHNGTGAAGMLPDWFYGLHGSGEDSTVSFSGIKIGDAMLPSPSLTSLVAQPKATPQVQGAQDSESVAIQPHLPQPAGPSRTEFADTKGWTGATGQITTSRPSQWQASPVPLTVLTLTSPGAQAQANVPSVSYSYPGNLSLAVTANMLDSTTARASSRAGYTTTTRTETVVKPERGPPVNSTTSTSGDMQATTLSKPLSWFTTPTTTDKQTSKETFSSSSNAVMSATSSRSSPDPLPTVTFPRVSPDPVSEYTSRNPIPLTSAIDPMLSGSQAAGGQPTMEGEAGKTVQSTSTTARLITSAAGMNDFTRALQLTATLPLIKKAFLPYRRGFLAGVATTAGVAVSDVTILEIRDVSSRRNSMSHPGMEINYLDRANGSAGSMGLQRSLLAVSIEVVTKIIFRPLAGPASSSSVGSGSGAVGSPADDGSAAAVAGRVAAASQSLTDLRGVNANLATSGFPVAVTKLSLYDPDRPSNVTTAAPIVTSTPAVTPAAAFVVVIVAAMLVYAWRRHRGAESVASASSHARLEEEA
jgi:hypothetical protein